MATRLYIHYRDINGNTPPADALVSLSMDTLAGVSVQGLVNGSLAGATQRTLGNAISSRWVSGRVPAGGFTLSGTMTFSVWAQESQMNANAGLRARVYRLQPDNTLTELGGPYDDGVELGTSSAEMTWTASPPSTAFNENDRLVVDLFYTGVGTMGDGFILSSSIDAPDASAGDSFVEIAETVAFKSDIPSFLSGLVDDSDRDWANETTTVHITFDSVVEAPSGQETAGHSITVDGQSETLTYVSGNGTATWVFRVPVLIGQTGTADNVRYSYVQASGATTSVETGFEVAAASDVPVTNNTTLRIRLQLKDAAGSDLTSTTVKFALFTYINGDTTDVNWMTREQKGTATTSAAGLLDVEYTGFSFSGATVYLVVISTNASPTQSMIWTTTVR